jgi:serine/threonine protein kinase
LALVVYTSSGTALQLEDVPFASKGEGSVYRVITKAFTKDCVKIYHDNHRDQRRRRKLEYMASNPPDVVESEDHIICWPKTVIIDKHKNFLGFIMPLAFEGSAVLYEIVKPKLSKNLSAQWQKFARDQDASVEIRTKICLNVAIAIHHIHKTGKYVLCDFKPENLLISSSGKVSIIDSDSFQIAEHGKVLHFATAFTPDYAPPERANSTQSSYIHDHWDRFSLAVVFYQILFGIHPFACTSNVDELADKIRLGHFVHGANKHNIIKIPPIHTNFDLYPAAIKNLFAQAFDHGHIDPNARPSAEDWGRTLFSALPHIKQVNTTLPTKRNSVKSGYSLTVGFPANNHGVSPSGMVKHQVKDNKVLKYVIAFLFIVLTVTIFYRIQTRIGSSESKIPDVTNSPDLPLATAITYGFHLNFLDRSLKEIKPEEDKVAKDKVKYIQPVIMINNSSDSVSHCEVLLRITGPDRPATEKKPRLKTPFTYSHSIQLSSNQQKEFKLNMIDINCPKCPIGLYRFEVFIGKSYFTERSYLIY